MLHRYSLIALGSDVITACRLPGRKGRVQINSDWIQFRTENAIHNLHIQDNFYNKNDSELYQGS